MHLPGGPLAMALLTLILAGCDSSSSNVTPSPSRAPDSTISSAVVVHGSLHAFGGPSPGTAISMAGGFVRFISATDVVTRVGVGADGRFKASLAPGRYVVTGGDAGGTACAGERTIDVSADHVPTVDLGCAIP